MHLAPQGLGTGILECQIFRIRKASNSERLFISNTWKPHDSKHQQAEMETQLIRIRLS